MSTPLVLSVAGTNRTLTLDSDSNGKSVWTEKTGPLLGRVRFEHTLKLNAASTVQRASWQLGLSVLTDTSATPGVLPSIGYKQFASGGSTVMLGSTAAERTALADWNQAIATNAVLRNVVINGVDPASV